VVQRESNKASKVRSAPLASPRVLINRPVDPAASRSRQRLKAVDG